MLIWSLLFSICFIDTFTEVFSEDTKKAEQLSGCVQRVKDGEKADSLGKAKLNLTSNGSFIGEFGNNLLTEEKRSESPIQGSGSSFVDPERELLKELISNLLSNPEFKKNFKRLSEPACKEMDQIAEFKPKLDIKDIPIKVPSIFGIPEKCGCKNKGFCWCKEDIVTRKCTWETDCYCATTVTCGPTKPRPEHRDKWCFVKTPNMDWGRTHLACHIHPNTLPVCSSTGYTPCRTFTPPCVRATPNTMEPCVCPTKPHEKFTCPCGVPYKGEDLYSFLAKRAAELPEPFRNETMALLSHHLPKRFHKPVALLSR